MKSHVAGRLLCSCCMCVVASGVHRSVSSRRVTAMCAKGVWCSLCNKAVQARWAAVKLCGRLQEQLGVALITNYLESVFCQQCCAAKTTNARSNHHNIGLLGGVLCLVWLLQDGASSCLSLACCQGFDSFWVKCPDTPSIAVVAQWSEDILAAKAV